MANQNKLKAWVRYDGTNTVVTAGPIFRASKPKVGNWKQINADLCCNGSLTTTTTTTNGGGVTPTAWVAYTSYNSTWSCQQINGLNRILYTSVSTLTTGVQLYVDPTLAEPYNYFSGNFVAIDGVVWEISEVNGLIINPQSCSSTTTTTSTQGVQNQIGYCGTDTFEACAGIGNNIQIYYNGSLGIGSQLYQDSGLTIPYNPNTWGTYVRLLFQNQNQVSTMNPNGTIASYTAC